MTKFGWEEHNGDSYASQTIDDPENGVRLNVQWVKPDLSADPNHWVLRVEGESLNNTSTEM